MTVCIAAICGNGTVICAADRMKTAGDIEFEPQVPKYVRLSNSIFGMTAGDSSTQAEIYQQLGWDVNERINKEPTHWLEVKFVAELYEHYMTQTKRKRAERTVLAPFGLTCDSFIERQGEMSVDFINMVSREMVNFRLDVATIITGIDATGPHIFVVDDFGVRCMDSIGFAAIGIGDRHAESQFMFAGHTREKPPTDTMLLVCMAKKRAEVSPGVGKETDMFMIGPNLGLNWVLPPEMLKIIETVYAGSVKAEKEAWIDGYSTMNKIIAAMKKEEVNKTQGTPSSPPPA